MNGQRLGYIRVSSLDQNIQRQLEDIPVGRVFTDKASGKDTKRPQLEELLKFAQRRRHRDRAQHGPAGPQPR